MTNILWKIFGRLGRDQLTGGDELTGRGKLTGGTFNKAGRGNYLSVYMEEVDQANCVNI